MGRGRVESVLVTRWDPAGSGGRRPDRVAVEEPLEIRLDGTLVATTMRTPGDDFELAVGLCHGEGLLAGAPVQRCRYCGTGSAVSTEFNVVSVETGGVAASPSPRLGLATAACGLCGSTQLDGLLERLDPLPARPGVDPAVLVAIADRVRPLQHLFAETGGVHAAAAADLHGDVVVVREDIGRHNAVDKVVGRLLLDGALPAGDLVLSVSGRAGFELVQKAWAAGFRAMVAVGAPSALAVEAARRANLQLAGFARDGALTQYAPAD